jgi:hypothetical protein
MSDANVAKRFGPAQFAALDARARRRLIAGTALRLTLTTCSLLAVYYLIPLDAFGGRSSLGYFVVTFVIFGFALVWQVRSILRAEHPGFRAVEAIGVALPLLVIIFATAYVSLAYADSASFSEVLNRTAGLYFAITVLSTVGFGDITPKTDPARLIVAFQMVLDLVMIGVTVNLIVGAARTGMETRRSEQQNGNIER